MRLLKKESKNTKDKFSFLEQPVPEIQNTAGKKAKEEEVQKEWTRQILQQLVAGIPWGHNLLIMKKVKDIHARLYYIISTLRCGWSG